MANTPVTLRSPSPDQRRAAAGQFDRANQVITNGDYDYGIKLLLECCRLDPANLIYRKALRQSQKAKHKNNLRGSRFAAVTTTPAKLKLKAAFRAEDFVKVLEIGEEILVQNPWDVSVQMVMARAFAVHDLNDAALWCLEQARQKAPKDLKVNRELARMYEKVGNFTAANVLWDMIRQADPTDDEAYRKHNDLAASETIARGNYASVLKGDTKENASLQETDEHNRISPSTAPGRSGQRPIPEENKLLAKIEAEPQSPGLYLQLASFYRRQDQLDRVKDILEKGLAAVGTHFELSLELADIAIQPFRNNLAITEAKLKDKPDDLELQKLRIQYAREIHIRELEIHRKKADRHPTDMSHRLEVGIRLLSVNQVDEAIQELQAARIDPRFQWKALMYLGFCFKVRKNWRLAQRNFEDALRNLPAGETARRKEILYQLATGVAESGDLAAAIEFAYELANEDFGYKDIGKLVDEWQSKVQGARR
jgi:tetratricopeptide (TPR) repeat protein